MNKDLSLVPLKEILIKSEDWIDINPTEKYKQVTVKIWGKGVVERNEVTGAEIAASKRLQVHYGQFILSKIDARHGAFGLIPNSLEGAVVTNDFPVFTPNSQKILPQFLDLMSKTKDFIELCKAASEGTTNRVRLKEDKFLSMKILLPALEEQRRIVARVEEIVGKIEEVRSLKNGVILDSHRLLLSAYHKLIEGAEYLPMKFVAPLQRRSVEIELSKNYPELGIRSFGKGTFHKPALSGAEIGTKKLFRIEDNDLLFQIVFAWEGAVAIAQPEDHERFGSHRFLTCVPQAGIATSSFLCFHFLTEKGLEDLGKASPGGAGRNRTLGLKALENVKVPVPLFEKQLWFDNLTTKVDTMKRLRKETIKELDTLLPSILDKAFQGEL